MKLHERRYVQDEPCISRLTRCPQIAFRLLPIICFALLLTLFPACKKEKEAQAGTVEIQWSKAFGGTKSDQFSAFTNTADGAYIVTGTASSNDGDISGHHGMTDMWVYKLDRSGNMLWQKALGGSDNDEGWSIITTAENGYLVAGNTNSGDGDVIGKHGGQDIWLVKLNPTGNIQWQKTLGGSGIETIVFSSIVANADGTFMIVGNTTSNDGDVTGNHGEQDIWLVKINSSGNIIWQKTLGGSGYDLAVSLIATTDGYLLTGQSNSNNGDVSGNHGAMDSWLAKVNLNGNLIWQKSYGGTKDDFAYTVKQTDGGYIMSGGTTSSDGDVKGHHGDQDAWVVKVDANGSLLWQKALGSTKYEDAYSLTITGDGGYLVGAFTNGNDGDVSENHGGYDAWLVKLNGMGEVVYKKTLGGSGDDNITNLYPVGGGAYLIGGQTTSKDGDVTSSHGDFDNWIFTIKGL